MTEDSEHGPVSMPTGLQVVRGLLWFQAVANLYAAVVVTVEVVDDAGYGRNDVEYVMPGLVSALVALLLAAVLTVCALAVPWPTRWVRTTIVVVEAVTLVAGVVALFVSDPVSVLIGIGIAATVLVLVNTRDVEDWFDR